MTCPDCKGTGSITMFVTTRPCTTCKGSGNVADAQEPKPLFGGATLFGLPLVEATEPIAGPKEVVFFAGFPTSFAVDLVPASPTPTPLPDPILGPSPLCAAMPAVVAAKKVADDLRKVFAGPRSNCITPAPDPTLGVAASAPSPARVSLDISLECDAENADTLIKMLKGPRFILHGLQTRTMAPWRGSLPEPAAPLAERTATMSVAPELLVELLNGQPAKFDILHGVLLLPADVQIIRIDLATDLKPYVFTLRGPGLPAGAKRVMGEYRDAMRGGKRVTEFLRFVAC